MRIESYALVQLLCVIGDHISYLVPMSKVSDELEDMIVQYHGRYREHRPKEHPHSINPKQLQEFTSAIEAAGIQPMRGGLVLPEGAVVAMMCQIV